jgi:hypothetical protein
LKRLRRESDEAQERGQAVKKGIQMNDAIKPDGMEQMLSADLAKGLAEAGFRAIALRRLKQAHLIFDTLRVFRSDRDFPFFGLALTAMESGEHRTAITLLEEGMRLAPGSGALRALLALALLFEGRKAESAALAQALISGGAEPAVLRFAGELQQELARRTAPTALDWNDGAGKFAPITK